MTDAWWCVLTTAEDGSQGIVGPFRSEARALHCASRYRTVYALEAYAMPMETPE